MGANEVVETEFRKTLRRERESRKWSQAHMAKLLNGRGLAVYPTTIAKIETGERGARIDELVAIADIFGVSVDALLGHSVDRVNDETFAVRALMETARHTRWQAESMEATLRRQINDLATFNPRGREKAVLTACEEACEALANATAAIRKADGPMAKIQSDMLKELMEQQRDEFLVRKPKGDKTK